MLNAWLHVHIINFRIIITVGSASGRASACKNEWWVEIPAWLSLWSEVQMSGIWSSWCHCHPIISCFIQFQTVLTFLVPAYPGCPGKEAWLSVYHFVHSQPLSKQWRTGMLPTHAALNGNWNWKSFHLFKTCESSRLDLTAGLDTFLGTTPSEGILLRWKWLQNQQEEGGHWT